MRTQSKKRSTASVSFSNPSGSKISSCGSDALELRTQIVGIRDLGMVDRCRLRFLDTNCLAVVGCGVQQQSGARAPVDHSVAPVDRNSIGKRAQTFDFEGDLAFVGNCRFPPVNLELEQVVSLWIEPRQVSAIQHLARAAHLT